MSYDTGIRAELLLLVESLQRENAFLREAIRAHIEYWDDDARSSDEDASLAEEELRAAYAWVLPEGTEAVSTQPLLSVCPAVCSDPLSVGAHVSPVFCDQEPGHHGKHAGYSEIQRGIISWSRG